MGQWLATREHLLRHQCGFTLRRPNFELGKRLIGSAIAGHPKYEKDTTASFPVRG
jgi:hypothetical protein